MNLKKTIGLIASCVLATADAQSTKGLIAYFPFNGNAQDESGHGCIATVSGATLTADRFGNPASAYAFNGTSAYISAAIPNLPSGLAARTMTSWIKPNQPQAILSAVGYGAGNASGQFGLGIGGPPTHPYYFLYFWKGATAWYPTLPIPTNSWYFMAVTYTNQQVSLWLNDSNATWNVTLSTTNNGRLFLGATSVNGSTPSGPSPGFPIWFAGAIDDVLLYDRALTEQEIRQIYLSDFGPSVHFVEAFTVDYTNLSIGTTYQLQMRSYGAVWTNIGAPFIARSANYTNVTQQRVGDWGKAFFRLQVVP